MADVTILQAAAEGLHRWRGHDRPGRRWADALTSGGLSLIFGRSCTCQRDAGAVIGALLDAGLVVVDEAELKQYRDAFVVQEIRRGVR